MMANTLIFLGTGTSSGVPILGCRCQTCLSLDPRDTRLRTSAYLITSEGTKILIDVGPDFRIQALRHQIHWVDGILITHSHCDHIGGMDELRQLNFVMKRNLDIYANALALDEIQTRFDYVFKNTQQGGGKPQLTLHLIRPEHEFAINGHTIRPLEVQHGQLSILGFQFRGLSYITDASALSAATVAHLKHTEVLVINTLRFRYHPTHFTLKQTLEMIEEIQPRRAYLVHMTHDIKHADVQAMLPSNVSLAHDNLAIEF